MPARCLAKPPSHPSSLPPSSSTTLSSSPRWLLSPPRSYSLSPQHWCDLQKKAALRWTCVVPTASDGANLGGANFPTADEPRRLRSTTYVRPRGNVGEISCSGHPYLWFWVSASLGQPPHHNGAFGSWRKWQNLKTHFSRWIDNTLTANPCKTRSYFQVTISNC